MSQSLCAVPWRMTEQNLNGKDGEMRWNGKSYQAQVRLLGQWVDATNLW